MSASSVTPRVPWPALGAALVALVTLWLSGAGPLLLPGLAAALVLSRVTAFRLPDRPWIRWAVRIPLVMLAVSSGGEHAGPEVDTFIAAQTMEWFGQGCAVELTLLCWIRHPAGTSPAGGFALLSALTLLAGCHTPDARYVPAAAPLFVVLAIAGFRGLEAGSGSGRWTVDGGRSSSEGARGARGPLFPGLAAIGVALCLGAGLFAGVSTYRGALTQWGNTFLLGQGSQITGLTSAPLLGRATDIRNSFTRALRVEGASGALYLRSMSFPTYDAGQWLPTASDRKLVRPAPGDLRAEMPGGRLHITRLAGSQGLMVAPLETAGIEAPVGPLTWSADRTGPLRTEQPPPSTYGLVLSAGGGAGLFTAPPGPEERQALLALTDQIDPRVRKLAAKIAGVGKPALEKVRAVERYLQGAHAYSLKAEAPDGEPVSAFLLERRPGHCEYFASAATLLLRCLDVPARYVTGFYAWERTGPDEITVRERDAHAWAEAWVEGQGWVTVDATPADGRPDEAGRVPLWTRAVEWTQDRAAEVLPLAASGVLTLTAAAGLFAVARRVGRRVRLSAGEKRRGPRPYTVPAPGLTACAARFERLLARAGHPCPPDRTWEEHLEALSGAGAAFDLQTARQFVRDYYAARFGGGDAGALVPLLRSLEEGARSEPPRGAVETAEALR